MSGWNADSANGTRPAGIRTYGIAGLLGGGTSAILVALVANAFGRLALAAIASPIAYWGQLAIATGFAGSAGAVAHAFL
ncbi:hypothetical protein [Ensifer canadensis]|uniref:hypothetical protein n=1 Tax=Ensifer canadensis TaxID=555315 RepID=UPI00148FB0E5|nr:hypothetical protein [Ensifer canadensis]